MKTERKYIKEMLDMINRQIKEIAPGSENSGDTDGPSFRMGRYMAYREVASQLKELLNLTDPHLHVGAANSSGKRVWIEWDGTWMDIERVEPIEYGRVALHGKTQDGKAWETDCVATEPLRLSEDRAETTEKGGG